MKIVALFIYRTVGLEERPLRLASTKDLSSFGFFTRGTVSEHLDFATRTVAQRTLPAQRQSVGLEDNPFEVHTYNRADGLCGICVADREYPVRVAFGLINHMLGEYEADVGLKWSEATEDVDAEPEYLKQDIAKYQDPKEADKIMKIQNDLDEIKDIMHKNIDQILQRGVELDQLMEKSEDLSASSKMFAREAKKTNACCKSW